MAGKPLIGWAIEVAKQCPSLDRVIVSTEDLEIAETARGFGAEIPFLRPEELARDDSAELLTWKYCLRTLADLDGRAPQVLVNIPATSPLRAVEDVEACIARLHETGADLCLTVKPAASNPYFNMVTLENGLVSMAMNSPTPIFRRQDAPAVFEVVPVAYAARASYVLQTGSLLAGKVTAITVAPERSVDIDTAMDLAFVEFLMDRKQKES